MAGITGLLDRGGARGGAQMGALDRTVHLSFGDVSGQEYVMQLTADLAIHACDLARATGQDDTLDPVPLENRILV